MKDVIIVLGGGIAPDGTLKGPSMRRVELARDLYYGGTAQNIIVSSKYSYQLKFIPLSTIAAEMKIKLVSHGVPATQIIEENLSRDTISNVFFVKKILKEKNWYNIEIVTSSFQFERARYLCGKILGADYKVSFSIAPDGLSSDDLIRQNKIEKELLGKTKKIFEQIKDGNDEEITKLLQGLDHPDFTIKNISLFWHSTAVSPFHQEAPVSQAAKIKSSL